MKKVAILTGEPTVSLMAQMQIEWDGVAEMGEWVRTHRPECLPDGYNETDDAEKKGRLLFPHDLYRVNATGPALERQMLTHNELLVELAGRKCYDSFGLKAGKKSNREYIANTQMHVDPKKKAMDVALNGIVDIEQAIRDAQNAVPHASITYHAKMTFFIAGVSRRVSHELIRNYVGADRDEEGSTSQESTRYTEHYGFYVAHPRNLNKPQKLQKFADRMQRNYDGYLEYIAEEMAEFGDRRPTTIERKRVLESASPELSHACETSWIWTTNPGAIAKMIKERDNDGADLEFRRLAKKWKKLCMTTAPNLFPQPWMQT